MSKIGQKPNVSDPAQNIHVSIVQFSLKSLVVCPNQFWSVLSQPQTTMYIQ